MSSETAAVVDGIRLRVVRCGTCDHVWFTEAAPNPMSIECPTCRALVDIPEE